MSPNRRHRAAHVRDTRRRHRDLVGEADGLGGLEDRVDGDRARRGRPSIDLHVGERAHRRRERRRGPRIFGTRMPASRRVHDGAQVLQRLARVDGGCTRAKSNGAVAPVARASRNVADERPGPLALGFRERRARLLEIDHDRVGARGDGALRSRPVVARARTAPSAAAGPALQRAEVGHGASSCEQRLRRRHPRTPCRRRSRGLPPACRRTGFRNVSSRKSRSSMRSALDELERLLDRLGHVGARPNGRCRSRTPGAGARRAG